MGDLELTREALDGAVLRASARHPVTLGATALGAGSALLAATVGGPIAWGVAGAALALGAGSFCVNRFARRDHHARRYVESVRAARERARLESLGRLRATLFDLAEGGPGADVAARGLEQYQRLHAQQDAFRALVTRKLNVGELTYVRYVGAVDHAYDMVVANLSGVVDRLAVVARLEPGAAEASGHIEACDETLARNDAAITGLVRAAGTVAEMRDLDAGPERSLALVVDDLERLAERPALE